MGAMDELIGRAEVTALHAVLAAAAPAVNWDAVPAVSERLEPLSLRGRTDLVAEALVEAAGTYGAAAKSFRASLDDPAFTGWIIWPVTEAAVTLALAEGGTETFDDALTLLAECTPRLTAEFAIRRLLQADPDRALAAVRKWTGHPDARVRRLASEGTRPYLPWAIRVPALLSRPEATLPILEALYDDPDDSVRRSVANHANDLARHAPDLVLEAAARWQSAGTPGSAQTVRHALRTLIKKGNPRALELMGFPPARITVTELLAEQSVVRLPGKLTFSFLLTNTGEAAARLAVDYAVQYVKANGSTSEKVFKLATVELGPGQSRRMSRRHTFEDMTTRRHYSGMHALELQVNGERCGRLEIELLT